MDFCRASWGQDYHLVLRDRLQKLEAYLIEKLPDIEVKSMVDTGELVIELYQSVQALDGAVKLLYYYT